MKNLCGIFIVLITVVSCDNRVTADFEVANNTELHIDSLKIEPNVSETKKFIALKPSEKVKYKSDMTTIEKTDGYYVLSYLLDGKNQRKTFGYYTNGYPLEKVTKINIQKDTVIIDQIFDNY